MNVRVAIAALVALAGLAVATGARAGGCPDVPASTFAFISFGADACPVSPAIRWTDARTIFDCRFLADPGSMIDCAGDAATCVDLCRASATIWNDGLPGRFSFEEATDPTEFCNDDDGLVSVGGTRTLCDGSGYGANVLAVTLSIFFSSGPQKGSLIDANITVNQRFTFSQNEFQATLAHEFGHVLGLSHPDQCDEDFNVLMRSSSAFGDGDACFVVDPTEADLNGAQRIYPVVSPTPGLCGDADQNGTISVLDGVQTLRAAAELPSSCTPARCDVDGNGVISVSDGVNVLRGAAGLSFAANCP